jgi:hypothetical protein
MPKAFTNPGTAFFPICAHRAISPPLITVGFRRSTALMWGSCRALSVVLKLQRSINLYLIIRILKEYEQEYE